jgi:hypothetical protein
VDTTEDIRMVIRAFMMKPQKAGEGARAVVFYVTFLYMYIARNAKMCVYPSLSP